MSNSEKKRSLSEQFRASSPNTQKNVLGITGGVYPSSSIDLPIVYSPRRRVDSAELSPVTKSVLAIHGIRSVPVSLLSKIDSSD
mgnify:CR=1 FL=1